VQRLRPREVTMSNPGDGSPSIDQPADGQSERAAENQNRPDAQPSEAAPPSFAPPPTEREAAQRAAQALTPIDRQRLAADVVRGMGTTEQQKAAAEGVVGALPSEAK